MAGKILGTILIIFFLTFVILLTSFYFMHQTVVSNINDINYNVAEIVATAGEFSQSTYDYLKEQACRFGRYKATIKLEKYIKEGVYDTYYDTADILGKKLKVGDRVTIYLEDQDYDMFGKLVNTSFIGYKNDRILDLKTKSLKSVVIANNAKDILKGYDIIAEIQRRASNSQLTASGMAIQVKTKLNPAGNVYGTTGHPNVSTTNLTYGDTADEKGNTGINYIFDNGEFLREIEYYPTGLIKLIRYIQQ